LIGMIAGAPLTALLTLRLPRRLTLILSLGIFAIGHVIVTLSPSLGLVLAAWFLITVATGAFWPVAAAGLAMVTGPVAGGILVSLAGWRSVFWATIPVGLVAVALTGLLVPDSRAPLARHADPAGQALVCVVLAALAGDHPGSQLGWLSWRTVALLTAAAAALAGLAPIESRRADPLIQLGVFRSTRFTASIASGVCGIAALAGFGFLSSLYLQDVRAMSALDAGLTIGSMAAEMAVCAPLAGRMIDRRGARGPGKTR
jgi:predicted MFS family arabinose efflux permease